MKAVPEGTYDAVIVDSSDPIGNAMFSSNICFVLKWKFEICLGFTF